MRTRVVADRPTASAPGDRYLLHTRHELCALSLVFDENIRTVFFFNYGVVIRKMMRFFLSVRFIRAP